ncbi:hypothetical protein MO867_21945 [Microbulbifer sp. OS29]|uniref:Uncharacterized protein n=1 Tax=Microbulbifer okhotskensis TaxID=2926617 RepID=A0A9X2J9U1_9GAMM|nr:hypothetical protein [Microbulbifer okhotskensis]MCO1336991.1 hypothetical protein [Microbulbifer okhotskensis]
MAELLKNGFNEPVVHILAEESGHTEEAISSDVYSHLRYLDDVHKETLVDIAKSILSQKNGITLHELALDIANLHGLSGTSKKQPKHILELLNLWAGIKRDNIHKPVVWLSPNDIVDEIPWAGSHLGKRRGTGQKYRTLSHGTCSIGH